MSRLSQKTPQTPDITGLTGAGQLRDNLWTTYQNGTRFHYF
nr:MAG TPA: hypothetical protein [Caudoviricetes sp.]